MKKSKTLILEINLNDNNLFVSLHNPNPVIWEYQKIALSEKNIDSDDITTKCNDMIDALNRYATSTNKKKEALNEMKFLGSQLCNHLIPEKIQQRLVDNDVDGRSTYLILSLDDNLVHIPWELLLINNKFLCEIFRMGRIVKTRQEVIDTDDIPQKDTYDMFIVANPTDDLECAEKEGLNIIQDIEENNRRLGHRTVNCDYENRVSPESFKKKIGGYDILHFSGHAYFDADHPEKSGWRLTSGNLTAQDIRDSSTKMPLLVISNACQSARTDQWHSDHVKQSAYGMSNAFILNGTKHYIGSLWDVGDKPGFAFGTEFYNHLFSGLSVGDAMFLTRQSLINNTQDISFAFVLYGDPTFCYIDHEQPGSIKKKNKKTFNTVSKFRGKGTSIMNTPEKNIVFNKIRLFNYLAIWTAILFILFCLFNSNNGPDHIKELLLKKMDQRQERIDSLFTEIINRFGPINAPQCHTIAVNFDTQFKNFTREKFIQAAIESEILDKTNFQPLATDEATIEEIFQIIIGQGPPITYQFPKIMVMTELYENCTDQEDCLLVRIISVERGQNLLIANRFPKIQSNLSPLDQKEVISKQIIEILNKIVISGRIIKIESDKVTVDIGQCQGVKHLDDIFEVRNKKTILRVQAIRNDSSVLTIISGPVPEIGDEVIYTRK
jgi:CHAT domain-containing protein